jgi:plasmid segregation protein ParM
VYSSVAALVGNTGEPINLVIGSPTNDFELDESVDSYKELVMNNNDGNIQLKWNGSEKSFKIASLEVFPEGMAVLPRAMNKKSGKIHVVDIGGQNVNYRLYDEKGNTIKYFSLDYAGMNKMENFLQTELRLSTLNQAIDFDSIDWNRAISEGRIPELDVMINNGEKNLLIGFTDTADFVKDRVEDFIDREIVIPFGQRGIQLVARGHAILFTGGGSLRLENHLKEFFSDNWDNIEVSKTAKWDNCISYAMRYLSQVEKDKDIVTKAVVKIIKETKHPDFEENRNIFAVEEALIG